MRFNLRPGYCMCTDKSNSEHSWKYNFSARVRPYIRISGYIRFFCSTAYSRKLSFNLYKCTTHLFYLIFQQFGSIWFCKYNLFCLQNNFSPFVEIITPSMPFINDSGQHLHLISNPHFKHRYTAGAFICLGQIIVNLHSSIKIIFGSVRLTYRI